MVLVLLFVQIISALQFHCLQILRITISSNRSWLTAPATSNPKRDYRIVLLLVCFSGIYWLHLMRKCSCQKCRACSLKVFWLYQEKVKGNSFWNLRWSYAPLHALHIPVKNQDQCESNYDTGRWTANCRPKDRHIHSQSCCSVGSELKEDRFKIYQIGILLVWPSKRHQISFIHEKKFTKHHFVQFFRCSGYFDLIHIFILSI